MKFKCIQILITVLIFFSTSCNSKPNAESIAPAVVSIRQLKPEKISDIYSYPGRVKAKTHAIVLSENEGIIRQVNVVLGRKVRKQESLMTLIHTDPIYEYSPVYIKSPISGVISTLSVTAGSHVVQGQKLASVIDPSHVELEIEVPAQDLSIIKKDLHGEFRISEKVGIEVQVIGVSPFVDPLTGTAEVQLIPSCQKKNEQFALIPGFQGQVTFYINSRLSFQVPDTAIVYKDNNNFVRIVENKKIKFLPVVLGKKQRGYFEVVKGLNSDMLLVERLNRFVTEGESVIIEDFEKN